MFGLSTVEATKFRHGTARQRRRQIEQADAPVTDQSAADKRAYSIVLAHSVVVVT